jgi:hypothetical protein
VHPTLGILRKSQAVSHASAFFQLDGFAVPAPAQVTQPTYVTKDTQQTKENLNWLLLLTSVLLGLTIALLQIEKLGEEIYSVPVFGAIAGAFGGIIAGLVQVFSWNISRKTKTALYIVLIISTIVFFILSLRWFPLGRAFLFLLLVMLPGVVSFLVIFSIIKIFITLLTKSPVNLWLFGLLFIIYVIISITIMAFLAHF